MGFSQSGGLSLVGGGGSSSGVTSVFGRVGDVTALSGDYAAYYIKLDGTSTTTAVIPFAEGIEVTGTFGSGTSDSQAIYLHMPSTPGDTVFGIRIDGLGTDVIRFDGALSGNGGIFNYLFLQDSSLFFPPDLGPSGTGCSSWSYGAAQTMAGSRNILNHWSFYGGPQTTDLLLPFTATVANAGSFRAVVNWAGANAFVTNYSLFSGEITATNTHMANLYGLNLPDITQGQTLNYAIKTGLGQNYLGDKLTIKGNFLPDATATYDFGTAALHWRAAYIDKISSLTSNGFVKTSGADGTLSIDTSSYITGNQTITLSGDASGSGTTAITVTLATVTVPKGGTGITSGTSGGIPYFSGSTTIASTAALSALNLVKGGGAGVAPYSSGVSVDDTTNAIYGYAAKQNVQSGTTYTLASTDAGKVVELNNASAITLTLPNSLPVGFCCSIIQTGAGQVTITAGSGATVNNSGSFTKTRAQYSMMQIYVSTNAGGSSAVYITGGDGA